MGAGEGGGSSGLLPPYFAASAGEPSPLRPGPGPGPGPVSGPVGATWCERGTGPSQPLRLPRSFCSLSPVFTRESVTRIFLLLFILPCKRPEPVSLRGVGGRFKCWRSWGRDGRRGVLVPRPMLELLHLHQGSWISFSPEF